jgi:transposase-like protein
VKTVDRDWSKLRKWMIRQRLEGKSVTAICAEAQVDRKMFYRWWSCYQTKGWNGLEEKTKGCPSEPGLNVSLKKKVIQIRKDANGVPTRSLVASTARVSPSTTTRFIGSSAKLV